MYSRRMEARDVGYRPFEVEWMDAIEERLQVKDKKV